MRIPVDCMAMFDCCCVNRNTRKKAAEQAHLNCAGCLCRLLARAHLRLPSPHLHKVSKRSCLGQEFARLYSGLSHQTPVVEVRLCQPQATSLSKRNPL